MTREDRTFQMKVLGRMLEHLGSQMYKRRDTALAELVANAWDAGASSVELTLPTEGYDPATSEILIKDNGWGMAASDVEDHYLVVGRNRRAEGEREPTGRKVMGRKGIGKLAGFGIASVVAVETKRSGKRTTFEMDLARLKLDAKDMQKVDIPGVIEDLPADNDTETGTTIALRQLRQATAPDVDALIQSLGRRFSRVVHGEMAIVVNGVRVEEPDIDYEYREPDDAWKEESVDGGVIRFYYGFSKQVLPKLLQGFTLYAHGKTAQAPPFFFNVESTASGQHGTRYLYGAIEVDYLDAGDDDEGDLISTDRQEIDWEATQTQSLLEWGQSLTRRALREWAGRREEETEREVLEDENLGARIEKLDKPSQDACRKTIRMLGRSSVDPERKLELAGAVISAFEYQQFHDAVSSISEVEDPDELAALLGHLIQWKVLESRAILEVVKGRLQIIGKFHELLVNDAPETAPAVGADNVHDLIAGYPWLLDPEWQVLYEERTITRQLKEWAAEDIPDADVRQRFDFLALASPDKLVLVEIKRSGHAVELEELQRLQTYRERLLRAHRQVDTAFVSGPNWATDRSSWEGRPELTLLEWEGVYRRAKSYYEQYRAVLEADVENRDFSEMQREVAQTRRVLEEGSYRGEARAEGLGPQYVELATEVTGEEE